MKLMSGLDFDIVLLCLVLPAGATAYHTHRCLFPHQTNEDGDLLRSMESRVVESKAFSFVFSCLLVGSLVVF